MAYPKDEAIAQWQREPASKAGRPGFDSQWLRFSQSGQRHMISYSVILPKRIYIKDKSGHYLQFGKSSQDPVASLQFSSDSVDLRNEFEAMRSSPNLNFLYVFLATSGDVYIHSHPNVDYYNTHTGNATAFDVVIARGNMVQLKDGHVPSRFMCSIQGSRGVHAREYINEDSEMEIVEAAVKKEIFDILYDINGAKVHDADPLISLSTSVRNDSDGEATQTITYSHEKWAVGTWNNSAGVELRGKMSFKAGVPFIASTKWEISLSASYSHEWGSEEGVRHTVTVPPKKKVRATIIVRNAEIDVGFTCTQKILWPNRKTEVTKKDGIYNNVDSYHVDVELTNWEDL